MPLILATTQVLRVSLRQICVKSAKSKLLKFTARFQPFSESRPFEVQFHPSASQEVGVKNVHRCTHLKPFQLVWTRLNLFPCCPPPRYIRKTCERRFASCDQPIPEAQKRSKIWCLSRTPFPLFSVYVFQCVPISSKFQSALTIDHFDHLQPPTGCLHFRNISNIRYIVWQGLEDLKPWCNSLTGRCKQRWSGD